eukprot:CAMPEP_0172497144 /NCGR_PEP_ID=MMETSP1066-20121228/95968_1 /TAXON_ID=671091 /ORGANISM="Coscinodiscus wailesii, Strain CCMP2513" /LENGTH=304 /DNA_ID=CAMNT_0013269759 /DNA_START=84 /DNA_END=998 /DNA_ORIENTATION=+
MPRQRPGPAAPAPSQTSETAALLAADRALSKQNEYIQGIKKIQASGQVLAERIAHNGELEKALLLTDDDGSAAAFLLSQREILKNLARENARRVQGVDNFIASVGLARDEIQSGLAARRGGEENGGDDAPLLDYERYIFNKMEEVKQNRDVEEDLDNSEFVKDMRSRLGEKERRKKKKRRSGAAESDDDDDLEVMTSQTTGVAALKCPITGMLFENPVKSKQCGHTYSSAGLAQMWRNKKRKCPVSGCANQNVTREQLEEDHEMEMKVKQYKRRQDFQQKNRMSQDSLDGVHDDTDVNRTTVID